MQRLLLAKLLAWKNRPTRKPLLIDGARQTGKTYLLRSLLGDAFKRVLSIDFLETPAMADAFAGALTPETLLTNLELLTGQVFNPQTDLLILDEIGECPRAVTSLKYFAEQAPQFYVAASGSNIGLLQAFPVGKVEAHPLRPLTFREFLIASDEQTLISAFNHQANSAAAHGKLFDQLTDYYFTGGMPEAVRTWFELSEHPKIERVQAVTTIHRDLVAGYLRDFGKYAGKADATLIEAVFRNVPAQLSMVKDGSVKRFKFKGVHARKSRYHEFDSAITWLEKSRLVLKNYPIEGTPRSPLAAYKKDSRVKLFLFDVGLLNHMLGVGYREIKQQSYQYKGYVAENFVQQEFTAQGLDPTYSWHDARAEIEFIIADETGSILPVEVKSGHRTRAKSLQSYITKCKPSKTVKLIGAQGAAPLARQHVVLPLYYSEYVVGGCWGADCQCI